MCSLSSFDQKHAKVCDWVVGIDEAGRGAWAGPVVAAAVVIPVKLLAEASFIAQTQSFNDSKQLTASEREGLLNLLEKLNAEGMLHFAFGSGSVEEIEKHNILGANRLAMERSLRMLSQQVPDLSLPESSSALPLFDSGGVKSNAKILIDGLPLKKFPYAHEGIVKGDGLSLSIAMASIVAKVKRDQIMKALEEESVGYGFAKHKGYGTKAHQEAIRLLGPSLHHRKLFLRKFEERMKEEEEFAFESDSSLV